MNEAKSTQQINIHEGKHLTITGVNTILAFDEHNHLLKLKKNIPKLAKGQLSYQYFS